MGIVQVDEQRAGEKRQIHLNAVENNIYNVLLNLKGNYTKLLEVIIKEWLQKWNKLQRCQYMEVEMLTETFLLIPARELITLHNFKYLSRISKIIADIGKNNNDLTMLYGL